MCAYIFIMALKDPQTIRSVYFLINGSLNLRKVVVISFRYTKALIKCKFHYQTAKTVQMSSRSPCQFIKSTQKCIASILLKSLKISR